VPGASDASADSNLAWFDYDRLDPENPLEIDDGNRVHLLKHLPTDDRGQSVAVGVNDILDLYVLGNPVYDPARKGGWADWLMVGEVPGLIICVPLAQPKSGDVRFCRPIGIYKAPAALRDRYLRGDVDE